MATLPALADWRLYLVDWGYNTAPERARAAQNPRIEVVGIQSFQELAGLAATAAAPGGG